MPQIEVTLSLNLDVADPDAASYFVNPTTNEVTASFIADIFDEFSGGYFGPPETTLLTVNNKTSATIQAELTAEADANTV